MDKDPRYQRAKVALVCFTEAN